MNFFQSFYVADLFGLYADNYKPTNFSISEARDILSQLDFPLRFRFSLQVIG